MITERLMEPGTWDLELAEMPRTVWDQITPGGESTWLTVCVTPTHLDPSQFSATELQSKALYGGVLTTVNPTEGKISGPGLAWHLGGSQVGQLVDMDARAGVTLSTQTWIERAISGHAPWGWNPSGLLLGTNTSYAVSLAWAASTSGSSSWVSRLQILEWLRDAQSYPLEWRVSPSGLISVGYWWEIFPDASEVVVARRETAGYSDNGNSISFGTESFGVDRDSLDIATEVILEGKDGAYGYGYSPGVGIYPNHVTHQLIERGVVVSRSEIPADWVGLVAAAEVAKRDDVVETISLSGSVFELTNNARPMAGGFAHVWDPPSGLYDYSAPSQQLRGTEVWPKGYRIESVSWPVERGMGVYATWWGSVLGWRTLDLTDYVVPEAQPWRIEVNKSRRGIPIS